MKRFSVENKINILIVFAVIAVFSAGYLLYNSLNVVLDTFNKVAQPNFSLIALKEIYTSLQKGESNVEYYSLTGDDKYLVPYFEVITTVDKKIDQFNTYNRGNVVREAQIDTISYLIEQKFRIWDRMLSHQKGSRVDNVLNRLSDALGNANDSITVQVPKSIKVEVLDSISMIIPDESDVFDSKSNIFSRIFKKKPEEGLIETLQVADVILVEEKREALDTSFALGVNKDLIQGEIVKLKLQEGENRRRLTAFDISLRRKNNQISFELNTLIAKLEKEELESLVKNAEKADKLVDEANTWVAIFLLMFFLLLVVALYVIKRYIRKSRSSQIALTQAKDEALKLSQTKERFLANMSHEIRTPMNAIIGFTEQILQMPLDSQPKEQLGIVKNSADHLLKIINDILDFSKLEIGKMAIENHSFSVRNLFNQAQQLYKPSADLKEIDLLIEYSEESCEYLIGDSFRLRQIIFNLISNAIKFTATGKVNVKAHTDQISETHVNLTIEVRDTGIGIREDKLNSIFEEFTQAEPSTSRNYGGTGLGLAIVEKLVKLLNGSIEVRNNKEGGACFTIRISSEIGEDIPASDLEENNAMGTSTKQLSNIKFLVADDDEYNRKLIQHILEKWKVKHTIVENGKETLAALSRENYDMLLLDIQMPEVNGIEVTTTIRNKEFKGNSNLPIIALTATNAKEELSMCVDAGVNQVLIKPYTEVQLKNKIIEVLLENDLSELISVKEDDTKKPKEEKIVSEQEFSELYELAGNDLTFVEDMLKMFIKSTRVEMGNMTIAFENKNWLNLAEYTHKITSPCKHLDADNIAVLLKDLEINARKGVEVELISKLFKKALKDLDGLMHKVQNHIDVHFT